MIWNVQSMNKKLNNRLGKIEFVRNILNNNGNIDIIFLIDVNNIEYVVLEGYNKYNDNRNILFIKSDIHMKVEIKENLIYADDMIFSYVTPDADNRFKDIIKKEIKEKKIIIGDFNLKSNKDILSKIKEFHGEESLQLGIVNKTPKMIHRIDAPSDHLAVIMVIYTKVKYSMSLRLSEISIENTKRVVKKILNGDKMINFRPKIRVIKNRFFFNDRDDVNNKIIDEFIKNNVQLAYRKYNYIWKFSRKEPFLGTYVNNNIVDSFAKHLKEIKNKIYENQIIDNTIKYEEYNWNKKCKSLAINYDGYKLNSISKGIEEYINSNNENKVNIENMVNNVLYWSDKLKDKLRANTFFLLKNPKLENFNDVRCIIIMPTLVKIYESLIYSEISKFVTGTLFNFHYQYGGIEGGSTYKALFDLREKMEKYETETVCLFDMEKGYDSINLEMLQKMVLHNIHNDKVKYYFMNWIIIVKNLDIVMNNKVIKRSRGIPMGLSLSPIVFVFYVHNLLLENNFDFDIITMYIDDLAMVIPNSLSIEQTVNLLQEINNILLKGDLVINKSKSKILTVRVELINKIKSQYSIVNKDKYLGRELKIGNDNKFINDDRFYFEGRTIKGSPSWINFAIKRLIITGGINAKVRYKFFMWPTNEISVKKKIWENAWNYFNTKESKYSYVQLCIVCGNLFRLMLDPVLIKSCIWRVAMDANEMEDCEKILRENLKIGKDQIDKNINDLSFSWINSINELRDEQGNDIGIDKWFLIIKNFTECAWHNFKIKMITNYVKEKKDKGLVVYDDFYGEDSKIINSKIVKNFSFINDIIFNHPNKNKNKQYLLWGFLDNFIKIYDNWKNDDSWKVNKIISFNNFEIRKIIFDTNGDWDKIVSKKNSHYWKIVSKLINLENKIQQNINYIRSFNKLRENIIDKYCKLGVNSLKDCEVYILNMNMADFERFKIHKKEMFKKNKERLKLSFKEILKIFIIFDTIYGDKEFNNCTFSELKVNFSIKLESIQDLANKVISVIENEQMLQDLDDCDQYDANLDIELD